jgi:ketosteroid isomerase-like protein
MTAEREVAEFIREWILVGWQHSEEAPYDFRKQLGKYYDWSSADVILHDNADTERRVVNSPGEYGAIWDAMVPQLRRLSNTIVGEPVVMVEGDLAMVSVRFVTRFESADGTVEDAPTLSSLILRRTDEGWKIIREHGSSLVPEEPAAAVG